MGVAGPALERVEPAMRGMVGADSTPIAVIKRACGKAGHPPG